MDRKQRTNLGSGRPEWVKAKAPSGEEFEEVMGLVTNLHLHTVCQSARCPNIGECWRERTATFLILGNTCTRSCGFCAVPSGKPLPPDENEPQRVAQAAKALNLRHIVVTSVTRDDLPDGGASVFAATIRAIKTKLVECSVEVLIPDFQGSVDALRVVLGARPDILNHNVETVRRMYPNVRPQADYAQSIELLRRAKDRVAIRKSPPREEGCFGKGVSRNNTMRNNDLLTKSGIMVGVGETMDEVIQTMQDLRDAGCDILTIGQYLRPSFDHVPIDRYYTPQEFENLRNVGMNMTFRHIESGPLVRSSYHAARAMRS